MSQSNKARQASILELREDLGLDAPPVYTMVTLNPKDIIVEGEDTEDLLTDAHGMRLSVELLGFQHDPAVLREEQGKEVTHRAIWGRRRILLAREMGESITVRCYEHFSELQADIAALSENLNRRDAWLQVVEKIHKLLFKFGWPEKRVTDTVSKLCGVTSTQIKVYLRIAQLHPTLLDEVLAGRVTQGDAKQLFKLTPEQVAALVAFVEAGGKIDAATIKSLYRKQMSDAMQGDLFGVEEDPECSETPAEGDLITDCNSFDVKLARDPKFGKARMILKMLRQEIQRVGGA